MSRFKRKRIKKPAFHRRSFACEKILKTSQFCGCYCCFKLYSATEVKEFVSDPGGRTPICPKCGIDSVIPFNKKLDTNKVSFLKYLKRCHRIAFSTKREEREQPSPERFGYKIIAKPSKPNFKKKNIKKLIEEG